MLGGKITKISRQNNQDLRENNQEYEWFWVVSRSAEQKQKVYYPRVSAEAEDVRYTIRGFGVLIKNDFEV